ncbi:MAG: hypothetical protein DMD79_03880 [Candidatus Rokuibacteriota bacterium]|nr:MAG: hypothetical protein DMD79_03880 [Candidatus Rokubacteria bacterium]
MIVLLAGLAASCGRDTPAGPSPNASTAAGITQRVSASTHAEVSGCQYGPTGIPGRRTRTFADVLLVTETTTTRQHGRHGAVFDTSTATRTERLSSSLVSDVCDRI